MSENNNQEISVELKKEIEKTLENMKQEPISCDEDGGMEEILNIKKKKVKNVKKKKRLNRNKIKIIEKENDMAEKLNNDIKNKEKKMILDSNLENKNKREGFKQLKLNFN